MPWRLRKPLSLLLIALASIPAAVALRAETSPPRHPDQLAVLSVTDVKGKTSPCGCHIPKGGLSRQASFLDTTKDAFEQVVFVDNGGYFPESDDQRDVATFLMQSMKALGMLAVGTSEKELRWGIAYLRDQAARTGLPVISSNLLDAATHRPALKPYVLEKVGRVRVGIFSLMSDKVDLGRARDSLKVDVPDEAARRTVAEMRKKGATVVILLSQLGKIDSEDLVAAVPGIDAVICGHNAPLIERGRMIKNTIASYGGEQGQYMSRTLLTLDAKGRVKSGENASLILDGEVGENPAMFRLVKAFEDQRNERMRREEREQSAAGNAAGAGNAPDHFLGMQVCIRCHTQQHEQWKTTAHALAWQTLVDAKKDATPECVSCHVVGYQQPGGFQTGADAPQLANVQCENCHGFGSTHGNGTQKMPKLTAQVCQQCHNSDRDPEFDFGKKIAMIVHGNTSGESVRNLQSRKGKSSMH